MSPASSDTVCLNCGSESAGPFCSRCGQRATPPHPTLKEMVVDAWHELTVFDGRLISTLRGLARPGALTLDFVAGKRARYIPPLRLYLIASLAYFLLSAVAPTVRVARPAAIVPGAEKVTIDLMTPGAGMAGLSQQEQEQVKKQLEDAPWWIKPLLERVLYDPAGMRRGLLETIPRALFLLVPVFAAIVAIFFRRRFPLHLVFALHLHAAAFAAMAIRKLANFTHSLVLVGATEIIVFVVVVGYAEFAFRRVYGDSWPRTLLKSAGIAVLYACAGIAALIGALAWASMVD